MHYHAEVYVPPNTTDLEAFVKEAMAPHHEEYHDEVHNSFWDWYQIGGRWTGEKDPNYDPTKDPQNAEECRLCLGTGFRNDPQGVQSRSEDQTYTCNGCGKYDETTKTWGHTNIGPGRSVKWPTEWAKFKGDIMPISVVPRDLKCFTLIVGDQVFHQEAWNGDDFVKTEFDGLVIPKLKELEINDGHLVTVDYHT